MTTYIDGPGGRIAKEEDGTLRQVFSRSERIQHRIFSALVRLLPAVSQRVEDALYHIQEAEAAMSFITGEDAGAPGGESYSQEEAADDVVESLGRATICLEELFHGET